MSEKKDDVPQAPEIRKQWRFTRVQMIGVPLLMLIPLLALLGLFGESFETGADRDDTLSMEVFYPTRYRYKMINDMVVSVENISAQTIPTVTVTFDNAYISQFSTVTFEPALSEITTDAYYVALPDVKAGETRQVVVELQAERYWWHEGVVAASVGSADAPRNVAVEVSTLVFP